MVAVKDGASNGARFCCGHHRRYRDGKLRGTVKFSARQCPSIFPLAEIDGNSYFPYFTPFFAVKSRSSTSSSEQRSSGGHSLEIAFENLDWSLILRGGILVLKHSEKKVFKIDALALSSVMTVP